MADNNFLTYKERPLVKCGNEIYYGDMAEPYVIRFTVLSTVKAGDNLYSIARAYGTTVDSLIRKNNLKSTTLKIGQILTI